MTRIPNNIKAVGETIDQALEAPENWGTLDDNRKMQTFNVEHYGIKQRRHVLSSETSRQRAIKNVDKHVIKEGKTIEKQLFHLQDKRFSCAEDAIIEAAEYLAKKPQAQKDSNR